MSVTGNQNHAGSLTGNQIRAARAGLGIKLRDLAQQAKVAPATLSRIENGQDAHRSTLSRIRVALEARGAAFEGIEWVYIPVRRRA